MTYTEELLLKADEIIPRVSFDDFKNFEDRGFYFNKLVKKYLNVR